MTDEFVTLVVKLREAQKLYEEQPTRGNLAECNKWAMRVDKWIQSHIAQKVQLELWTRSVKSSELPGAYDVEHETLDTQKGAA